jgi:hypothetical protein
MDCPHCEDHGSLQKELEWISRKIDMNCQSVERIDAELKGKVSMKLMLWLLGGFAVAMLSIVGSQWTLADKFDAIGSQLTKDVHSMRIETLNKLSDIKVNQFEVTTRTQDFGERLEGLAQNQKILMKKVTESKGEK